MQETVPEETPTKVQGRQMARSNLEPLGVSPMTHCLSVRYFLEAGSLVGTYPT
jgi:hypothetical protein